MLIVAGQELQYCCEAICDNGQMNWEIVKLSSRFERKEMHFHACQHQDDPMGPLLHGSGNECLKSPYGMRLPASTGTSI